MIKWKSLVLVQYKYIDFFNEILSFYVFINYINYILIR